MNKATPQPQQESLQVPEITPEQEDRFAHKFPAGLKVKFSNPYDPEGQPPEEWDATDDVRTHLATELALQRREYEPIRFYLSEIIDSIEKGIDCTRMIQEAKECMGKIEEKRVLTLLQKETI